MKDILKTKSHTKWADEEKARLKALRKDLKRKAFVLNRDFNAVTRKRVLNDKQRHLVSLLADFMNRWPAAYIQNQVGINQKTYRRWRNDPLVIAELDKEITRRKTLFRKEAYFQLLKLLQKGNTKALMMYFKMTGDLREHIDITETPGEAEGSENEIDQEIAQLSRELGVAVGETPGKERPTLRVVEGKEKTKG